MRKHAVPILLILVFGIWSLRSIFHPGFMYSHDSFWHVERLMNMSSLISTQFPVRWSPTLDNGFGIPLFNFTYPAPYYLGVGFMALGLGPVKTYDLLLLLGYLLGGLGIYTLGSKKPLIAFIAALLYMFTPYQFLDIFVRGALGEVMALGLIPWVILTYEDLSSTGRLKWFTSIPLALLILSHNFYAYLFGGLLTIFTLVLYHHKSKIILSFLFSLALSAFFILPVILEKSFLLITQTDSSGYLAHFVYPLQLLYGKWIYLGSVSGNDPGEMSFQLGLANIIIIIASLGFALYRLIKHQPLTKLFWYLLALCSSIFMMLPQSTWFWSHVPLMSSLQFPWRFLGLAAILVPLIYLEISRYVQPKSWKIFLLISLALLALAIYNTRNYGRPVKWMNEDEFLVMHYSYAGQNTTANRNELVPRWAATERNLPPESPLQSSPDVLITHLEIAPLSLSFTATAPSSESSAIYYRNYYPSWVAYQDNQSLELAPTVTGEIKIPLTQGEHHYVVKIASTFAQKLGNYLSLIALGIILYLFLSNQRSR